MSDYWDNLTYEMVFKAKKAMMENTANQNIVMPLEHQEFLIQQMKFMGDNVHWDDEKQIFIPRTIYDNNGNLIRRKW